MDGGTYQPRVTLRDYQELAVQAIREAFGEFRRVLFVLPTGGGKTVVFSHIAEQAMRKGRTVVIVAHRRRIVNQISAALDRLGVAHGVIAPKHPMTDHPVQVGMIQTIFRRLDRIAEPDLLVVDEAHHGVAGTWERVSSAWTRARILGVSATPERLDGKGLRPAFDEMVIGPYPRELIERGALSDYEYLAPPNGLDLSGVKTRGGDYALDQLAEMLTASPITGDAVEHYGKHLNGKPAVVFCVNIMHAQMVAERFRAVGWKAASVDGKMSADQQEDLITALGDGRLNVLTSCELISEGVDVPNVAGCILLRPTKSLALWLQQVGRALRPNEDGSKSIILDHVGSVHRFGMPCFPRDWSLDGRKKRRKAADVTTCKLCFKVLPLVVVRSPIFECGGIDTEVCPFLEERESLPAALPEEVDGELQKVENIAPPGQTRPDWANGLCLETAKGRNWFDLLDLAGTDPDRLEEIRMARKYRHGWVEQTIRTRRHIETNANEIIACGRLHADGSKPYALDRLLGIIKGDTDAVLWLVYRWLKPNINASQYQNGDRTTLSYVYAELNKRKQKAA
jgi:DNA repair protein RadD